MELVLCSTDLVTKGSDSMISAVTDYCHGVHATQERFLHATQERFGLIAYTCIHFGQGSASTSSSWTPPPLRGRTCPAPCPAPRRRQDTSTVSLSQAAGSSCTRGTTAKVNVVCIGATLLLGTREAAAALPSPLFRPPADWVSPLKTYMICLLPLCYLPLCYLPR